MGFADSIRKTAAKQQTQLNRKITEIAAELFTAAVDYSPKRPAAQYSKGEFINNWMVGIGSTNTSLTSTKSNTGADSRAQIASIKAAYPFIGKDGYVTLSNSVHYAELVEYKGWQPSAEHPNWKGSPPYAPVESAFIKVMPKIKGGLKW